ncbi:hypothetical protein bas03_0073 [Escherichia phage JulesPiccard]|uniref:Uncharacterized protein n=1 Tax=Escherichia phage JulesPiccard TaxID=2851956 RepID=A0AAE7VVI3_9CAUD|nr:hypothetical protein bas03_0073 [Escherichia phage JulesPiccard]
MITINLSEEMAADLIDSLSLVKIRYGTYNRSESIKEVVKQVKQQVEAAKIELQNTPYDFNKGE